MTTAQIITDVIIFTLTVGFITFAAVCINVSIKESGAKRLNRKKDVSKNKKYVVLPSNIR